MARRVLANGSVIPMEPGERDRRVTIQQAADTEDTTGFPQQTWTTLTTVFMRKVDASGRERFVAQQLSSPYDSQWEMSYRADMDPDLLDVSKFRRLVYKGRTFDIVNASLIGRNEGIELLTLARQG